MTFQKTAEQKKMLRPKISPKETMTADGFVSGLSARLSDPRPPTKPFRSPSVTGLQLYSVQTLFWNLRLNEHI